MISRALLIIVVISSFPVLQLSPKVMAQAPSEGAKVLIDDVIQALKVNDTNKAQVHLSILNQQLPTFVNSTSIQSVKVLLDDVSTALKNDDMNNAIIHLNLVKQQFGSIASSTPTLSSVSKESTPSAAGSHVSNVKANHAPTADNLTITINTTQAAPIKLKGNDADGDSITYSIVSDPVPSGSLGKLDSTSGEVFYSPVEGCMICYSTFQYQVTDSHSATSNIAQVEVQVDASQEQPPTESTPSSPPPTSEEHSQPNSGGLDTTPSESTPPPGVVNENPSSSETDYSGICAKLQPVLIPSCSTLVNSDGSLTSEGTHAMHCIRNGILLGGGAALIGLPLYVILKGLSMLAAPTGCGDIVNMKAFDQLGDIGSLSSLTNLLP